MQYVIERQSDGLKLVVRPVTAAAHNIRRRIRERAQELGLELHRLPLPEGCEAITDLSRADAVSVVRGLMHLRRRGGALLSGRQRRTIEAQRRRLGWSRHDIDAYIRGLTGAPAADWLTEAEARGVVRRLLKKAAEKSRPTERMSGRTGRPLRGILAEACPGSPRGRLPSGGEILRQAALG